MEKKKWGRKLGNETWVKTIQGTVEMARAGRCPNCDSDSMKQGCHLSDVLSRARLGSPQQPMDHVDLFVSLFVRWFKFTPTLARLG